MRLFKTPDHRKEFAAKYSGSKVLDLGCGQKKTFGAIGVDFKSFTGVDIVHNLNAYPYPFPDNSFDAVILNHVIEHLNNVGDTIREVHRVLKTGGELWLVTPHFTDCHSWIDPTHRFHLSIGSFSVFCKPESDLFEEKLVYITLKGRWKTFGYEYFINTYGKTNAVVSRYAKRWEERHCFNRRGGEMFFILRKV